MLTFRLASLNTKESTFSASRYEQEHRPKACPQELDLKWPRSCWGTRSDEKEISLYLGQSFSLATCRENAGNAGNLTVYVIARAIHLELYALSHDCSIHPWFEEESMKPASSLALTPSTCPGGEKSLREPVKYSWVIWLKHAILLKSTQILSENAQGSSKHSNDANPMMLTGKANVPRESTIGPTRHMKDHCMQGRSRVRIVGIRKKLSKKP